MLKSKIIFNDGESVWFRTKKFKMPILRLVAPASRLIIKMSGVMGTPKPAASFSGKNRHMTPMSALSMAVMTKKMDRFIWFDLRFFRSFVLSFPGQVPYQSNVYRMKDASKLRLNSICRRLGTELYFQGRVHQLSTASSSWFSSWPDIQIVSLVQWSHTFCQKPNKRAEDLHLPSRKTKQIICQN